MDESERKEKIIPTYEVTLEAWIRTLQHKRNVARASLSSIIIPIVITIIGIALEYPILVLLPIALVWIFGLVLIGFCYVESMFQAGWVLDYIFDGYLRTPKDVRDVWVLRYGDHKTRFDRMYKKAEEIRRGYGILKEKEKTQK